MFVSVPRQMRPKMYCFTGGKENTKWYFKEYKISNICIGYDKEAKKPYFNFVCDSTEHVGEFIVVSLTQMLVLPFKHRLYFDKKKAKKRQHLNWEKKGGWEG